MANRVQEGDLDQPPISAAGKRVVIIGGGVIGCSILYHLTKLGWTDVAIVERSVLTAGSSWHAAGGVHALNADPNIAALDEDGVRLAGGNLIGWDDIESISVGPDRQELANRLLGEDWEAQFTGQVQAGGIERVLL